MGTIILVDQNQEERFIVQLYVTSNNMHAFIRSSLLFSYSYYKVRSIQVRRTQNLEVIVSTLAVFLGRCQGVALVQHTHVMAI